MHVSMLLTGLLATGALAGLPLLRRDSCSTPDGSGQCGDVGSCGGFSVPGYCPGDSNIQCCVTQGCSTPQGDGVCRGSGGCGGTSVPGYCPGDSSVQCCVNQPCSTPQGAGTCGNVGSCGGTNVPGYCPGDSNIQCCVQSSCSTPSGNGQCGNVGSCGGFNVPGYCPGDDSNQCCVSQSCSTSSGDGTCKNTGSGCSGGSFIAGACPGDSSIQCCVVGGPPPPPPPTGGPIDGLDDTQSAHAHAMMDETHNEGLPRQACLAAFCTGLTESSLYVYANEGVPESFNYAYDRVGDDHDSIGIFQQRASIYTDIASDMDPAGSARQFFDGMKQVDGWETMDVGVLCQTVQVSAYPDRYNEQLDLANTICDAGGF